MCTYLKNMEGKKPKELKNKSFDSIQKMFDRAFKRQKVDDVQETAEVDNDQETTKIKELIEIVPDEEVAIDAVPLATKPPTIVDWKIHTEGKKSYYQIIKADRSSKRMQHVHIHMLVEKKYPLTPAIITDMLNKKLQVDYFSEIAYQLLKLLTKQLKNQ
ncbi:hypothetical protein Tco_1516947 [Tanacetum coccineum]